MSSPFDLSSSAKPSFTRENLKTLSREELEQLLLTKTPLPSTNPSNTASQNPLSSSFNQSDHSITERIQVGEKNISQKIDSLLKFTSDLSLLPNSAQYLPKTSHPLLEESMSKHHRQTSSNFDTVTNLQKSTPNTDFQGTLKIGSRLRSSGNPTGNNNTFHNDSSDRLGSTIDRLRPSLEKSKRSVSPIFEKYGLSEKPSLQLSGNKNEIRCGNDSFGMPYHQPERDTFGPKDENSINSLAKNSKKDQGNSSGKT